MHWFIFGVAILLSLFGIFLLWNLPTIQTITAKPFHKISVIIPARNEEKRISPLLISLQNQLDFIHEMIVVDDHSTDQTAIIAKKYGAKVIQAEPLPKGWFGKPWACYQGAKAAAGEILFFWMRMLCSCPMVLLRFIMNFQKIKHHFPFNPIT